MFYVCLETYGFLTSKLHIETLHYKIQSQFVACRLYREGCGCVYIENLRQVMPHSWRQQKEIFFYVNVGVVMSCSNRKSKGVLSETRCSAVRTHYTRAIRQITRAPLSYIHTIFNFRCHKTGCRQPTQFLCTNLYIMIFKHNLWYEYIYCTDNTLIDVKFHEGSFESQQFASVDGRTSSLRFVRIVLLPLQKNIVVSFYSFLP